MKKFISLMLAMIMILSMFTVLPTVTAAETYVADTEVKITVALPDADSFSAIETALYYGESLEYVADSLTVPHIAEPITNTAIAGAIYINASSMTPYDISTDHILCTANFVVKEDVTAIDFEANIIDAYLLDGAIMNDISKNTEIAVEVVYAPPTEAPTETVTDAPTETETVTEEPTEEPTEAPTETETVTEEPTEEPTEAPTETETVTEEPTEAPTEAPTEEPTEAPVTDVTIRFAAPKGVYASHNWTAPVLGYADTQVYNFSALTQIPMTATSEVFYANTVGCSEMILTGAWTVYEVSLTAEQVEAINNAVTVCIGGDSTGAKRTFITKNILKAGIDGYVDYGTANDIATFDNHTFIITESGNGATSTAAFVGYWASDFVTVRGTAVLGSTTNANWDCVDLYYGNTTTFADTTKILMTNTGERTKVDELGTGTKGIKGRWAIYAVSLNPVEAATIEASKYVGFSKTGTSNRTAILYNILKAPMDYYVDSYNTTATTFAAVEDRVFVISNTTKTDSIQTYLGAWESEEVYTQGKDDVITLYFASPTGKNDFYTWGDNVELYYGNTAAYLETNRIPMTVTDKVYTSPDVEGCTLITGGDWKICKVELTVEQMSEIQDAVVVGFIKSGAKLRTQVKSGGNVLRASKTGFATYGTKKSIDSLDGYTFVIQGAAKGFEGDCYLGSWVASE